MKMVNFQLEYLHGEVSLSDNVGFIIACIGSNMIDTDQCPASNTVNMNTLRMGIPKCTGKEKREN